MAGKTVVVSILGDARGFEKAMAGAEAQADTTGKKFGGLASSVTGLAGAFGAFEAGKFVYDAMTKDEAATTQLNQAMKDAGEKVTPAFTKRLEETEQSAAKFGFTNDQTADSVAKLRMAGVDSTRALDAQGTIMDLARAKNLSLDDATTAVIKGMQGQGRALKDLNIELPPAIGSTAKLDTANQSLANAQAAAAKADTAYAAAVKAHGASSTQATAALAAQQQAHAHLQDAQEKQATAAADVADRTHNFGQVLDAVNPKVGGQAQAAAQTTAGKLQALKAEAEDSAAKFGEQLKPAMDSVITGLGFLADHANVVIPVLGTLTGLFAAAKVVEYGKKIFDAGDQVFTLGKKLLGIVTPAKAATAAIAETEAAAGAEGLGKSAEAGAGKAASVFGKLGANGGPLLMAAAGVAAIGVGIYELNKSPDWDAIDKKITEGLTKDTKQWFDTYEGGMTAMSKANAKFQSSLDGIAKDNPFASGMLAQQMGITATQFDALGTSAKTVVSSIANDGPAVHAFYDQLQKDGGNTEAAVRHMGDSYNGIFLTALNNVTDGYKKQEEQAAQTAKTEAEATEGEIGKAYQARDAFVSIAVSHGQTADAATAAYNSQYPQQASLLGQAEALGTQLGYGLPEDMRKAMDAGLITFTTINGKVVATKGSIDDVTTATRYAQIAADELARGWTNVQVQAEAAYERQIAAGTVAGPAAPDYAGHKAAGGTIPAGEWPWVGEKGPELGRATGSGFEVKSHEDSLAMLAGARGGDTHNEESMRMVGGSGGDTHNWNITVAPDQSPYEISKSIAWEWAHR